MINTHSLRPALYKLVTSVLTKNN